MYVSVRFIESDFIHRDVSCDDGEIVFDELMNFVVIVGSGVVDDGLGLGE